MSRDLKREYTKILWLRYQNANKKQKTIILDEFCLTAKLSRKYAIKLLHRVPGHWFKKRPGRKRIYSDHAVYHLRRLWFLLNQINSKRLKEALPFWIHFYVASDPVKQELLSMSPSTIDRKLAPIRARGRRRLRSGTRPGKLKHVIPIKPFNYDITQPGHVEADTVAHCGGSLCGEFIWSLTFTDILSGWTENRAVWGRGAYGILDALRDIEKGLPFPILSFNCDNGSEFLNHTLVKYFGPEGEKKRKSQLMTRSREYRKNDNCHVEQKNWTHVRETFGYDRFSNPHQVELMNSIYKNEHTLLQNFFFPQMKLKHKVRVGSRYRRTYDRAKTPYQRIMACEHVPEETKQKLTKLFKSLNPFKLRKEQEKKLRLFYQANRVNTEKSEVA